MTEELAKGYICQCGHFNEFVPWVYAHWDEEITHICHGCENKNLLVQRVAFHFEFMDNEEAREEDE